jgi:hypothetical protein
MIWASRVNKAGGLSVVDCLGKSAMQEGILDVELVNWPVSGESQAEDGADGGGLHNWTESLIEVNTRVLGEATENPARFVPIQGTIGPHLVLEDPLAGDDVGTRRARNESPSVVVDESLELIVHRRAPVWIVQGPTISRRYWGDGGGMK